MPKQSSITVSELRGLVDILSEATIGITDVVEAMNHHIVHPPFLPSTPVQQLISGIFGLACGNVRLSAKLIRGGLDKALSTINPEASIPVSSKRKDDIQAIINGIIGDLLDSRNNELAIPMKLRYRGKEVIPHADSIANTYSGVNGKILLMVHGLCNSDAGWRQGDHDHGEELARELNLTPLYVYYNGGRHISQNGRDLNQLVDHLVHSWPVPVEDITIVAHSMGGLLSRSAFHYGHIEGNSWINYLKNMVFLGTPHQGAPLERIGNYVALHLEYLHYVKPIARLGKVRSAGITDLRYGNLVDEDWNEGCRFADRRDKRTHIALPENVNCYTIAASIAREDGKLSKRMLGDGLVPKKSALGQHKHPDKTLRFEESNIHIAYETNHTDLLRCPNIYTRIKTWLHV